jgi:hypothetical protein
MKKLISLIIFTSFIFNGLIIVGHSNINEDYLFQTNSICNVAPIFNDFGEYIEVEMINSTILYEIGKPMLPVITKIFTYPFGSEIIDVNIKYDIVSFSLSKDINPCPPLIIYNYKYQSMLNNPFIDEITYCSNQLYPNQPVTFHTGSGIYQNDHVLFLAVKIVPQYNPVEDFLNIPLNIFINVTYKQPSESVFMHNEYDMVIITSEDFSETIRPLVKHKNNVGIQTLVKTTKEIYNEYTGRDTAEQIKYFIKDAIETLGIRYVLVIGDVDVVPMRKSDVTIITQPTIWKRILTDLYYADIYNSDGGFSDWDSNENNKFGECRIDFRKSDGKVNVIDEIDLYPDVGIGRLPVKSKEEVQIVSDKIIEYETNTHKSNWFNKIILMGGDTSPGDDSAFYEGEWFLEEYIAPVMESHGFTLVKLFTSLGTFTPMNINQEVNSGACFVSYAGHGNTNCIGTYPPNGTESISYFIRDIQAMNNSGKLPVFFLDACLTGKLDYNFLDRGILILFPFCLIKIILENLFDFKIYPCFAWSLLKKPSGGGIAVIAASQPSWDGYIQNGVNLELLFGSNILNRYFFDAYEEGSILCEMMIQAQNSYITMLTNQDGFMWDRNTIDEYNLIGDPSLKIGGYS